MQRTVLVFLVIASSILAYIGTDIILPSLPHIAEYFSAAPSEVKKILYFYLIGQFTTVLFWGVVADCIGRILTLLLGMLFFLIGSILSISADSIYLLHSARYIQGAGAVVAPVAGWALIQDLYPKDEGARVMAWIGTLAAILPLCAPLLGGYLDLFLGWRSNFYFIALYSFVLCILIYFISYPNTIIKAEQPQLKKRIGMYAYIIKNKTFISYIALFGLLNCGEWCFITVAPFYYASKNILPDTMGILLMCTAIGFVFGSMLAPKLFHLFGVDKTLHLGIQLALISSATLLAAAYFHWGDAPYFNALIMGLYIASSALLWGGSTSRALQCFEKHRGAASAVRSLILLTFASLGTFCGRLIPHANLRAMSFFLFFLALSALLVFHNKELKAQRITPDRAY